MSQSAVEIDNNRILIVDDNLSIHEDFKKILLPSDDQNEQRMEELEQALFEEDTGTSAEKIKMPVYTIESAYQGEQAIEMVARSMELDKPYALIYMDVRMPPGINGIEATRKIWEVDPFVEAIICTAYSDFTWDEIITRIGMTDKLLFLKKPFNSIEIKQITMSLVKKYNMNKQYRHLISNLEQEVEQRSGQLSQVMDEMKKSSNDLKDKINLYINWQKKEQNKDN